MNGQLNAMTTGKALRLRRTTLSVYYMTIYNMQVCVIIVDLVFGIICTIYIIFLYNINVRLINSRLANRCYRKHSV